MNKKQTLQSSKFFFPSESNRDNSFHLYISITGDGLVLPEEIDVLTKEFEAKVSEVFNKQKV